MIEQHQGGRGDHPLPFQARLSTSVVPPRSTCSFSGPGILQMKPCSSGLCLPGQSLRPQLCFRHPVFFQFCHLTREPLSMLFPPPGAHVPPSLRQFTFYSSFTSLLKHLSFRKHSLLLLGLLAKIKCRKHTLIPQAKSSFQSYIFPLEHRPYSQMSLNLLNYLKSSSPTRL